MARIAGVDLPRDKRIEIGLTYIYGIGRVSATKICAEAGVNPDTRVRDITDDEVKKISAVIDETQLVDKFAALYNGEVINTGEKRLVLHQLTRGQLGDDVAAMLTNVKFNVISFHYKILQI